MKKTRITGIVVGILVLTIAVAGASYAWFAGALDGFGGTGDAAMLNLTKNESGTGTTIVFDKVLPGQAVSFKAGSKINFKGNRGGIVEFSITAFDDNSKHKVWIKDTVKLTQKEKDDVIARTDDYVLDAVSGNYYMTPKRVKEIMEITFGGTTTPPTVVNVDYSGGSSKPLTFLTDTSTGKVYTYIPELNNGGYEDATVDFLAGKGALQVHFLGEFGGSYKGTNATQSADRQYEQESKFDGGIGLVVKAIQPTREAVADYLKGTAEAFVHAEKNNFGATMQDSWEYAGK